LNPKGVLCLASLKVYLNRLNIGCNSHFLLFLFSAVVTFLAAVAKEIFIQLSPKTGSHDAVQKTRKSYRCFHALVAKQCEVVSSRLFGGLLCGQVSIASRVPCVLHGACWAFRARVRPKCARAVNAL
jgi:hypothetical protein